MDVTWIGVCGAMTYRHWTRMHRALAGRPVFAHPAKHVALEEMLQRVEHAEALRDQLKAAILKLVPQWSLAPSGAIRRSALPQLGQAGPARCLTSSRGGWSGKGRRASFCASVALSTIAALGAAVASRSP